jgi:hypothetical protein
LNDDGGGHAMIFEGFDGVLRIAYHAPNTDPHLTIKRIAYRNGSLRLVAGDIADNSATGISNIPAGDPIKEVRYYNLQGLEIAPARDGVFIEKTVFQSGAVSLSKIIRK